MLSVLGFEIHPERVAPADQPGLVADLRRVAEAAPPTAYETPGGRRMSVKMTAAGAFGWTSGRGGYHYAPAHPAGVPWPPIPPALLRLWEDVTRHPTPPDSCLVNFYGEGARMALHRDDTEAETGHPVLSLSLGDRALFRMGGRARGDATRSVWLSSGDVVVIGGAARLAYHGIDRITFGSSSLLPRGGRLNVTLRVAGRTTGLGGG